MTSKDKCLDFVISDIQFIVTRHGNIKPIVIFAGAEELNFDFPNIAELLKSGMMIGDVVSVASPYESMMKVDYREGLERSPPIIPTHCPCCATELTMTVGRYTVIQCHNSAGCSAQAK